MKEAFVDLQNITNKIAAFVRYENEQLLAKYPPDIPNVSGRHAFVKGISIVYARYVYLFGVKELD